MVKLDFAVPKAMKAFVERQAKKHGFPSAGEYLRAVLGDLQKQSEKKGLESKLLEGLDSPLIDMNDRDWKELETEVCGKETE